MTHVHLFALTTHVCFTGIKGMFRLIRVCATIISRCFKGAWLSNMYTFLHSPRTRVVQVFKGVFVFNMQCIKGAWLCNMYTSCIHHTRTFCRELRIYTKYKGFVSFQRVVPHWICHTQTFCRDLRVYAEI